MLQDSVRSTGLEGTLVATPRIAILLLACQAGCSAPRRTGGAQASRVSLQPCHIGAPDSARRLRAKCGFVEVPENWEHPGVKIKLHVAIIAADSDRPKPDPLYFFAGGPGQAASESYLSLAHGFRRINRKRDVVLIDQRGTGRSHPLRCEPPQGTSPYAEISSDDEQAFLVSCIKSLAADLTQYTTTSSIRDFDHVRKRLGHGVINLYGISYGTRVALSYLRRYPERVRSVILDGVLPQDTVLGPEVMGEGPKRTKDLMIHRCEHDAACKKRYNNLPEAVSAVEARIRDTPPTMEVVHPRTGKRLQATLDWESWSLTLRMFGYSSETVALLPLLIHDAHRSKDLRPLVVQGIYISDMLRGAINNGLEASVLCSEDWPFFSSPASAPAGEHRYGVAELKQLARLCKIWPHRPVQAAFKRPVSSDKPVLILSGEIDPVTPPANGWRVAKTLSHSRHIVVPGQGHGVIGRGCLPRLAATFVQQASLERLDSRCTEGIKPIGFFLDYTGPQP